MRIAVFDYKIIPTNPIGGCHLRMLRGLCNEHEFTVFAVEFENPCPERIRWIRIPVPTRPLVLLFLMYHLFATSLWVYLRRERARFDVVQSVESNLYFGEISYAHFCHRAYLNRHWKQAGAGGLRGALRWLDHQLHAFLEPLVYRRVKHIVVPSQGLARELTSQYPHTRDKLHILPNPVDFERMRPTETFNRAEFRANLGLTTDDIVLIFIALGQFERKGLPLLLAALKQLGNPRLKLIVVGGENDLTTSYKSRIVPMGLSAQVVFVGMQRDVRPFLWAADAFAFPSFYEVFPLVSLEAAAAGLPLIVTRLNGVEEFVRDGENGIFVEHTEGGVADGISRFLLLPDEARQAMGEQARRDVEHYKVENFLGHWREFYASL